MHFSILPPVYHKLIHRSSFYSIRFFPGVYSPDPPAFSLHFDIFNNSIHFPLFYYFPLPFLKNAFIRLSFPASFWNIITSELSLFSASSSLTLRASLNLSISFFQPVISLNAEFIHTNLGLFPPLPCQEPLYVHLTRKEGREERRGRKQGHFFPRSLPHQHFCSKLGPLGLGVRI